MAIDDEQVRRFLEELFEDDLHANRILSLSHATLGTVQATSLSIAAIGKAMASRAWRGRHGQARGASRWLGC